MQNRALAILFHALRLPHWVKNTLLFLPLLLSHQFFNLDLWLRLIQGFFAFSCMSSSVYLMNDLLDRQHDQVHPGKQDRVIASGRLSPRLATTLMLISFTLSCLLSTAFIDFTFTITLLGYFFIAFAYSLWLKKMIIIDVIVLSSFYTLRLFAGAELGDITLSYWLISFSLFFFLSLAIAKRQIELTQIDHAHLNVIPGRSYQIQDQGFLQILGITTAISSLVLYALYIAHPDIQNLYHHPQRLWLSACAIFYWMARLWFLTGRGLVLQDPITWALQDLCSYFILGIITVTYVIAL